MLQSIFSVLAVLALTLAAYFSIWENKPAIKAAEASVSEEAQKLALLNIEVKEIDQQAGKVKEQAKGLKKEISTLEVRLASVKSINGEKKKSLDDKTKEVQEAKARLAETQTKISGLDSAKSMLGDLKEKQKEKEIFEEKLASKESSIAALNAGASESTKRVESLDKLSADQMGRISRRDLTASVRSVSPTWGFVIIDAGVNQGVVPGSKLEVVRGGSKIAELLVTAVEATKSAADIMPASVPEGESIQSGDAIKTMVSGSEADTKKK